jgi:hypothetical protein
MLFLQCAASRAFDPDPLPQKALSRFEKRSRLAGEWPAASTFSTSAAQKLLLRHG